MALACVTQTLPSAKPIQRIFMMEAPTLSRFLLRSRALWLTVFTLVFLSWAWWDSMEYSTELHYRSKSGRAFSIHSCNGGIGYTSGGDVGLFVMLFSKKRCLET